MSSSKITVENSRFWRKDVTEMIFYRRAIRLRAVSYRQLKNSTVDATQPLSTKDNRYSKKYTFKMHLGCYSNDFYTIISDSTQNLDKLQNASTF